MRLSYKYKIPYSKIDFINIDLKGDNKFFIDPYKLKQEENRLSI